MKRPLAFELLVDAFRSLPTIGTKNANRLAYFMLKQDNYYNKVFANRILDAKLKVIFCERCHNISEKPICPICLDVTRDPILCIVNNIEDYERIEMSQTFNGRYHIINGEINYQKELNLAKLNITDIPIRILNENYSEVLLATSFTFNGEATAEYIKTLLINLPNLEIYRIGLGIPLHGAIDYADDETLKQSILNKRKL